jgi:hypothetical protein
MEKTMNIEQKSIMQELNEEDYTKVYGGISADAVCPDYLSILPVGPIRPKKPETDR